MSPSHQKNSIRVGVHWWAFAVVAVSLATQAQAGVVYSTFGPGDIFNTGAAYAVTPAPSPQDVASPLPVPGGSDYAFTSLDIALRGGLAVLEIQLMTDSGGAPGSTIETLTLTNPPDGISSVASILNPTLSAGTAYWVAAHAVAGNSNGGWYLSEVVSSQVAFSTNSGISWTVQSNQLPGAFRVNGNPVSTEPVPEPASCAIFCLVAVAVLSFGRGPTRCFGSRATGR